MLKPEEQLLGWLWKRYLTITLLLFGMMMACQAKAENETVDPTVDQNYWALNLSDPFLDPTCPLMDPLTLYVLRQKLTLRGYQTILEAQVGNDTLNTDRLRKARIETYIPVIDTDSFQYMLGTKYKQVDIVAQDQEIFGKTVQVLWLFNAAKYVINERSNVVLIFENYERGIEKSFGQDPGNQSWGYGLYNYAFSRQWQLILIAGYEVDMMAGENKPTPQFAPELRWEPNEQFKLVVGAPVICAFEWSMTPELGIAARYDLDQDIGAFLRYKINEKFSLSLIYDRADNETQKTYFDRQDYLVPESREVIPYTNLTQMIDQISLDLGIRTSKEVGLNIAFGYAFGENITLRNNLDKTGSTPGRNELFLHLQLQFLKLWN
jgi:hypothetical protein